MLSIFLTREKPKVRIAKIAFAGLLLCLASLAAPVAVAAGSTNAVPFEKLDQELRLRMTRVPEFQYIKKEAEKMGVKAYLFGGTASGFAHYVRWDLLREAGDTRFQPDRFDYDFTNIYRSNQDLDIVVDGSADQVQALQKLLRDKFPYFQGGKDGWEVRSLRENLGGSKIALLNNPDFLNQNTDSNSTGLIEITGSDPHPTHDLFNWSSYPSKYLLDISEGKISYFDNPLHESTERYLAEKNPKIMSVVRYFIKAAQFELQMRDADKASIQRIIDSFDPKSVQGGYAQKKLEEIGIKLAQNAVNIEYAANLLEANGLRAKLIAVSSSNAVNSLAWWFLKEPLRTYQVGTGSGRTARDLGIHMVAHETNSFQAYESITRAHTGDPNVFISRQNVDGEVAIYGDGFYTKPGRKGARTSGITIRFIVNPAAREGADFIFLENEQIIIFKNKAALRVIPESLNFGVVELFFYLDSDQFDAENLGALQKLKRRAKNQLSTSSLSEEDFRNMGFIVAENLKDGKWPLSSQYWLDMGFAKQDPQYIFGGPPSLTSYLHLLAWMKLNSRFLESGTLKTIAPLVPQSLTKEDQESAYKFAWAFLTNPFNPSNSVSPEALIEKQRRMLVFDAFIGHPEALKHAKMIDLLGLSELKWFDSSKLTNKAELASWARAQIHQLSPEDRLEIDRFVLERVDKWHYSYAVGLWRDAGYYVVPKSELLSNPEMLANYVKVHKNLAKQTEPQRQQEVRAVLLDILRSSSAAGTKDPVTIILNSATQIGDCDLVAAIMAELPKLKLGTDKDALAEALFPAMFLSKAKFYNYDFLTQILPQLSIKKRLEFLRRLYVGKNTSESVYAFLVPGLLDYDRSVLNDLIRRKDVRALESILRNPSSRNHPEIFQSLIQKNMVKSERFALMNISGVISLPHWQSNPDFQKFNITSFESLKAVLDKGYYFENGKLRAQKTLREKLTPSFAHRRALRCELLL